MNKALEEEMARHFCRWDPVLVMVGLRLSNVMDVEDYAEICMGRTRRYPYAQLHVDRRRRHLDDHGHRHRVHHAHAEYRR